MVRNYPPGSEPRVYQNIGYKGQSLFKCVYFQKPAFFGCGVNKKDWVVGAG